MTSCNKLCTSTIPLLSSLDLDLQEKLIKNAVHKDFSKDDILVREEETVEAILIIRQGRVKLNRYDDQGKEYIISILSDGESLGEEIFLEKTSYPYNVEALTDGKLCMIRKKDFYEILTMDRKASLNLIRNLNQKLLRANGQLELLNENDGLKRIILFILDRTKNQDYKKLDLTIEDMAASTNLRSETISRKLRELEKAGAIERLGQKNIEVKDIEILYKILET